MRAWLVRRISSAGRVPMPIGLSLGATAAAALAGAAGLGVGALAGEFGLVAWAAALVVIPVFGAVYLGAMLAGGVPEAHGMLRRVLRRR